jgi:hypothetical protein
MMTTDLILKEIDLAVRRLHDAPAIEPKRELMDNVYPLLHVIVASSGVQMAESVQRLDEVEAAIAEYLTSQESMILPDLGARIQTVLALAQTFCDSVESAGVWGDDLVELPDELRLQIELLRGSCKEVSELVDEVTLVAEDLDESDRVEEEESDG